MLYTLGKHIRGEFLKIELVGQRAFELKIHLDIVFLCLHCGRIQHKVLHIGKRVSIFLFVHSKVVFCESGACLTIIVVT